MSRFVRPDTVTLTLANGDTLKVKKRLSVGEQRAHFARMYVAGIDGVTRVNPLMVGLSEVVAYLIDWHLKDDDMPIRDLSPNELIQVLDNLSPEDFAEIRVAIEAHEATMLADRTEKKTTQSGELASAPISPSPSAQDSLSTPSVIST